MEKNYLNRRMKFGAKGSVPNEEDRKKLEPFKDWLNNILAGEYENDDEE